MKTGIELITEASRKVMVEITDDFGIDADEGELKVVALRALGESKTMRYMDCDWEAFEDMLDEQTEINKLVYAGALIAAEIDRLQSK